MVRRDARALDAHVGGRVVGVGGELDGAVPAEVDVEEGLDDALAEGDGAEELRRAVVLQGPGEELAGRGGVAVDQHGDGHVEAVGMGAIDLLLVDAAPDRGDDLVLGQEDVRDVAHVGQRPAQVVPHVQHQGLHALPP